MKQSVLELDKEVPYDKCVNSMCSYNDALPHKLVVYAQCYGFGKKCNSLKVIPS